MLAAIRFRPYPEVPGVLARSARRGVARRRRQQLGRLAARRPRAHRLRALVDARRHVGRVRGGEARPVDLPRTRSSWRARTPAEAVHAGDDVEADVEGARAAGIAAVLVARDGMEAPAGVRTVRTLDALLAG